MRPFLKILIEERLCRLLAGSYLAMLLGISTTSCSEGLRPSIFMAGCRSCSIVHSHVMSS